MPAPLYIPASVGRNNVCGIRVSAWFKFCPEEEYVQSFGLAPPALRLFPLLLEDGVTTEKGVLVTRSPGDREHVSHMRGVAIYRDQGNIHHTELLDFMDSFREQEAPDTMLAAHKAVMDENVVARCCVKLGGRWEREIALRE